MQRASALCKLCPSPAETSFRLPLPEGSRNGTSDGDCVTVHGGKGCSYKTDQWFICNAYGGSGDAHCCTTAWDSTCVAEYRASFQYQESRAVGCCDDNLDNDGNGA